MSYSLIGLLWESFRYHRPTYTSQPSEKCFSSPWHYRCTEWII